MGGECQFYDGDHRFKLNPTPISLFMLVHHCKHQQTRVTLIYFYNVNLPYSLTWEGRTPVP